MEVSTILGEFWYNGTEVCYHVRRSFGTMEVCTMLGGLVQWHEGFTRFGEFWYRFATMLGEFLYNGMEVCTMLGEFWYNGMEVEYHVRGGGEFLVQWYGGLYHVRGVLVQWYNGTVCTMLGVFWYNGMEVCTMLG